MENKLYGQCFVIEYKSEKWIDPIIYFHRPDFDQTDCKLHGFNTPFEAKAFIQREMGKAIEITVYTGVDSVPRAVNF
jgi:hypothetical protein